jgi:hypothetical protein
MFWKTFQIIFLREVNLPAAYCRGKEKSPAALLYSGKSELYVAEK